MRCDFCACADITKAKLRGIRKREKQEARSQEKTYSYFHPEDIQCAQHAFELSERDQTKKGVKPCSVDCNGSTNGKIMMFKNYVYRYTHTRSHEQNTQKQKMTHEKKK